MKKTRKAVSLLLVAILLSFCGPVQVFATHEMPLTGGGDNILDAGETLSGTDDWSRETDDGPYNYGYLKFTVAASASVAGEDITFLYDPDNQSYNDANVMMDITNTVNSDTCWNIGFGGDTLDCVLSGATGGGTYVIDIYHNNGSPCDHLGLPCPSRLSDMYATATGGGGGGVPEFSDYMYILTIIIALGLMVKIVPKIKAPPRPA